LNGIRKTCVVAKNACRHARLADQSPRFALPIPNTPVWITGDDLTQHICWAEIGPDYEEFFMIRSSTDHVAGLQYRQ
jgi:hypothetical protein